MDTEILGFTLSTLIAQTFVESVEDIQDIMGECFHASWDEYAVFLLWIAARQVREVLAENLTTPTQYAMYDEFVRWIAILISENYDQTKTQLLPFMNDRFLRYDNVCDGYPTAEKDEAEVAVAYNFILVCTIGPEDTRDIKQAEARYLAQASTDDQERHMAAALRHYRSFRDKAKTIISRAIAE